MNLQWMSKDKKSYVSVSWHDPRMLSCQMKFGPVSEVFHEYCSSETAASKWFARQVEAIKNARNLQYGD